MHWSLAKESGWLVLATFYSRMASQSKLGVGTATALNDGHSKVDWQAYRDEVLQGLKWWADGSRYWVLPTPPSRVESDGDWLPRS